MRRKCEWPCPHWDGAARSFPLSLSVKMPPWMLLVIVVGRAPFHWTNLFLQHAVDKLLLVFSVGDFWKCKGERKGGGGWNLTYYYLENNKASVIASDQIRSDQSLSHVWLFAAPWIAARQASLSITNSRSSLRLSIWLQFNICFIKGIGITPVHIFFFI